MSNIISINYKFIGSDLKEMFEFYEAIWTNDKDRPRRHDWYYNCQIEFDSIIASLGFATDHYDLGGVVRDYWLEGTTLVIESVTTYYEPKDFRKLIKAKFPSIKIYYQYDDYDGNARTNDSSGEFFPSLSIDYSCGTRYFKTIEEVASFVSGLVGKDVDATEKAIYKELDNYRKGYNDDVSFKELVVVDDD